LGPTATAAQAAPVAASQAAEQSARAYLRLARGYAAAGRIGEAIQAWHQAARLDPANHTTWQDLSIALLRIGRLPDAIGAFRRAIAPKPDFAPAHHMLGTTQEAQGNEAMAVGALRGGDGAFRCREPAARAHREARPGRAASSSTG
jgi:tetratricopeptide (TPR) repeat protein